MVIFVDLQAQEGCPQSHRHRRLNQLRAIFFFQPPVAQVTVTRELSSNRVLMAGIPQATIGVNLTVAVSPGLLGHAD